MTLSQEQDFVKMHPAEEIERLFPKDADLEKDLERTITLEQESVEAPVTKGQVLGTVTLSYNGNTYTYDANGIRLSKTDTVKQVTTKFFISGTKILGMTIGTNKLRFRYGVNGIQGFSYNGQEYIYRKNIQGDITHIFKLTNGVLALAAEYKYDAWGKCVVTEVDNSGIGDINPIRYRGYYYDKETALYYLNARYYDPEVGRFISADSTQYLEPNTVNGLNLYAYCGNNPVINVDPSGRFFLTLLITAVVSAVVSAASSVLVQLATTGRVDWAQVGISALFGAVSGALSFYWYRWYSGTVFYSRCFSCR